MDAKVAWDTHYQSYARCNTSGQFSFELWIGSKRITLSASAILEEFRGRSTHAALWGKASECPNGPSTIDRHTARDLNSHLSVGVSEHLRQPFGDVVEGIFFWISRRVKIKDEFLTSPNRLQKGPFSRLLPHGFILVIGEWNSVWECQKGEPGLPL